MDLTPRHAALPQSRGAATAGNCDLRLPHAKGTGQGVYLEATARQVSENEAEAAMALFSERSLAQGGQAFSAEDVRGSAPHRL